MARRKRDTPVDGAQPLPGMEFQTTNSGSGDSAAASAAPGGEKSLRRISLVLADDGTFDLSSLRESSRATLRAAISDPTLPSRLGSPEVSMGAAVLVTPDEAAYLFSALGMIQVSVARLVLKYPPEVAAVFAYDEQEVAQLKEPAARVLTKHMGSALRYKDELTLAMMMLSVFQRKFVFARAELAARRAEKPDAPNASRDSSRAMPGPVIVPNGGAEDEARQ